MVSLVVARAANGVIGRDGELPWRLPSDLARFRAITDGGTVVMGRRTWESLPARFRPLPGRRNIVLSRAAGFAATGAEVCPSLDAALFACDGTCFVIGGGAVYAEALAHAARAYVTEVEGDVAGDVVFPALDGWQGSCEPAVVENGHRFRFCVYERG